MQMRASFAEQLPQRMDIIREAVSAMLHKPWDMQALEHVQHLLHSLIGASGTFGMATVGLSARYLDDVISQFLAHDDWHVDLEIQTVRDALAQLESLVFKPSEGRDESADAVPQAIRSRLSLLVYIVEDDPIQAEVLSQMLVAHEYRTQVFTTLDEFRQACLSEPLPFAIIMDMIFPEGKEAGAEIIAELKCKILGMPPILFVSVRNDMQARLAAYRAGANRYLCKPVQSDQLLRVLNDLALNNPHKPYRVLLVDDEPQLLEFHAEILRQAGMIVRAETNPLLVLDALQEFNADVLVLDVYMPECEGTELAAVIREDGNLARLPILFLSSETNLTKQIAAIEFGGDDFLVKPVAPAHLVMLVKIRAQRMRRDMQLMETLNVSLVDFMRVQTLQRNNGDLRETVLAHQQTAQELRVISAAFETQDAIMITDRDAKILRVNQSFQKITGYTATEVLGKNPRFLQSGQHTMEFYREMWGELLARGKWTGEIWDKRKNGEIYPSYLTITAVPDDSGLASHYVSVFRDVSDAKRSEEEIRNLAFYDHLTELPNRRLLTEKFHAALLSSDRSEQYGALLFLDLDRFKSLNDAQGHRVGDLMLVEVARRLARSVREVDTVARLGGDEFIVLLENLSEDATEAVAHANAVADKIRQNLSEPYQLNSCEHCTTPSIGVTLFYAQELSMDELFRRADTAMYRAKASGRNAVCFFDSSLH